jgi:hypothetical protein
LGLRIDPMPESEINKSNWPLYISKNTLSIMCQMYALRFNKEHDSLYQNQIRNEILQIWTLFLTSLKKHILAKLNDADGMYFKCFF